MWSASSKLLTQQFILNTFLHGKIWGSHGDEYEDGGLLDSIAV